MDYPCGTFNTNYALDKAITRTKMQWLLLLLGLALIFTLPFYGNPYVIHVVNLAAIYVIAALGLNLLTGYCGQISIGHSAFMAVGGFASVIMATELGFSFWVALPCAAIIAGLTGLIFGLPSLRVKGFYLVLSTLAAQFIIMYFITHLNITGAMLGLEAPPVRLGNIVVKGDKSFYFLIMGIAVLATFTARNLVRSKIGRAFVAIRDNDLAAEVMGIGLWRYKLLAFFVGCVYAGVAGALWAYWQAYISPEQFQLIHSVWFLGYIIVGGMGTTVGPILGVIAIVGLTEGLTLLATALMGAIPEIAGLIFPGVNGVFGIIIVLMLIFEPRGLAHRWAIIKSWYRLWPFSY